jgi:hypothetical protein
MSAGGSFIEKPRLAWSTQRRTGRSAASCTTAMQMPTTSTAITAALMTRLASKALRSASSQDSIGRT